MPSSYQLVNDILPSTEALYSGRYNYDDMPDPQSLSMGSTIIVDNHDGNISLYVDDGNNWINVATAISSSTETFGYRSDSFYDLRIIDENVATTGDYNDLMNTPPIEYINIDVCTNNPVNERFHNIINQVLSDNGL